MVYGNVLSDAENAQLQNYLALKYRTGLMLWVAGRDLVFNEKPDNAAETNAHNTVVPEWSYGYRSFAAGTAFTLFTPDQRFNNGSLPNLQGFGVVGVPLVTVNVGDQPIFQSNVRPIYPGQMVLHPSTSNAFAVVRWTAPAAGSYRILAEWLDLDPNGGNGASGHVVLNGTEIFGNIVGPDAVGPARFVGQEWDNGGNAEMPAQTFKLNAGDVLDFAVGSRGDASFDTTTFNAIVEQVAGVEITNAPPESRTKEGVVLPLGSDVTLEVDVQPVRPIVEVILRVNGVRRVSDNTPPYSFTETNLGQGFYAFDVEVVDVEGVRSRSETINVNVQAIPGTARTNTDGTKASPHKANAGGRTYVCTQSGAWGDPATWGGEGVPGRNDYAMISAGFQVNASSVEVDDLSLFGSLLFGSSGRLVVYDKFYAAGTVQGGGFTTQLLVFNRLDCLAGAARFRDLYLIVSGETVVTNDGAIDALNCVVLVSGRINIYSPPGTNQPATVRVDQAEIAGGVAIDTFGQFIHSEGLISDNGAAIIGNDSAGIIGNDSAGIIGNDSAGVIARDGASIKGIYGTPLIGMDGSSLIGNDGSTLVGNDGASLVSDRGGARQGSRSSAGRNASGDAVTEASAPGDVILKGAILGGKINVIGNLVNESGFVSPGNSAGKITVSGSYTQGAAGTLLLELGGTQTDPLQFDQLQIGGAANLAGNLIVKTINGYTPASGDAVSPLVYASQSGTFDNVSSNAQISFGANGAQVNVTGPNPPAPKALNIATRMKVETGDNALIAGFIITGSQPKKVIIRGIGPSLPFPGVLADPTLNLDNGAVTNDNWRTNQEQEIIDTTIPPSNNLESAIVATLNPGQHTAILRGSGNATGIGVVEVYDLDSGSPVQLANISSRGFVQAGDDVMIGGFIIGGTYPAKVIVRAIGPSLTFSGKLEDPTLELVNENGGRISNDNWRETQESDILLTTIPPTDNKEAAIVATLAPGNYTAIVRGKDGTTGIAVVEAYNLQ